MVLTTKHYGLATSAPKLICRSLLGHKSSSKITKPLIEKYCDGVFREKERGFSIKEIDRFFWLKGKILSLEDQNLKKKKMVGGYSAIFTDREFGDLGGDKKIHAAIVKHSARKKNVRIRKIIEFYKRYCKSDQK